MALAFDFVELGPDISECDASWYIPVISMAQLFSEVAWMMVGDVEGNIAPLVGRPWKFLMRWIHGADRGQPWLARSLPVDCRATD